MADDWPEAVPDGLANEAETAVPLGKAAEAVWPDTMPSLVTAKLESEPPGKV